jgi:hypothetical protein
LPVSLSSLPSMFPSMHFRPGSVIAAQPPSPLPSLTFRESPSSSRRALAPTVHLHQPTSLIQHHHTLRILHPTSYAMPSPTPCTGGLLHHVQTVAGRLGQAVRYSIVRMESGLFLWTSDVCSRSERGCWCWYQ